MSERAPIPFHRSSIGREEIDEVVATLESGWLTTGPRADRFEREFRAYADAPQAVAVNSCTAALHLALVSLGIGPGDEVITTPLTFCATVNTILHAGATPLLADVGPDGNIDPESIRQALTARTRAVVPVHLAGLPCAMDEIWRLAGAHGLKVIEDAAHAAGARYRGRPIGAACSEPRSDAAAFSFYATKNLTAGEGGMLTTGNAEIARRARSLTLHGISRDAWSRRGRRASWRYEVVEPGFKYNLSDLHAAIGLHQLRKLESFIERRAELARLYGELLGDVDEIETPRDAAGRRHTWHLYMVRLRLEALEIDRAEFVERLAERGVGSGVHFIPIPLHPAYRSLAGCAPERCPRALEMYPRLVSLPMYPGLRNDEVERVAAEVKAVVRSARKAVTVPVGV